MRINNKIIDLKGMRTRLNLTQIELAVKLDICLNTLISTEKSKRKASRKTKIKIEKFFNL